MTPAPTVSTAAAKARKVPTETRRAGRFSAEATGAELGSGTTTGAGALARTGAGLRGRAGPAARGRDGVDLRGRTGVLAPALRGCTPASFNVDAILAPPAVMGRGGPDAPEELSAQRVQTAAQV